MKSSFYRPELDVLRFCAAFSVFVFHAFPEPASIFGVGFFKSALAIVIATGAYGVDLFFGISSFLITQLLLREREQTATLDIKAFYVRRILRIWPLYFAFVLFAYGLTFVVRTQQLSGAYVAAFFLMAGNWMFILRGTPHSVSGALWSISLEEQFYLSWPHAVKKARMQIITRIVWGLLLVATVARIALVRRGINSNELWFNTLVRLDPLAMGILLAVWLRTHEFTPRRIVRVLLVVSGVGCWLLVTRFTPLLNLLSVPFWNALLGYPLMSLGSITMLAAVYGAPQAGLSIFANKWLAYFGKISYGIYVYHELCIAIAHRIFVGPTRFIVPAATAFPLTLLFAALSYRFLEAPFLRLKEKFAHVSSRSV